MTAANGKTLRDAVISTQKLATDSDADLTNKGTARSTASNVLTSYMRLLVGNLAELVNPDGTRWLDFGLEIPASIATPAAPSGLTVTSDPTQELTKRKDGVITRSVLLTCDMTQFADRYRFPDARSRCPNAL
ncbi:MAG: hypothetical protein M3Y69_01370 [Verrucomicrobiota bacterium]|nr:hypothetical protein [Verrucomicrobiota bacterium]